ncbi:tautomerase family protein, partial [Listeria seeligeri]|nr:tautomerase family protein [Listeria seeligeri]
MPLVKIFHGSNFTEEAVKKVNQTIHLALVECFDIPK